MIVLVRPECPNPAALAGKDCNHPQNKEALRKSTFGKCMYCESKIEHISYSHVEHIKPKSVFPELEFSWDNLGFSCQVCNTKKGHKYDVNMPFINPYDENPEDYIVFLGNLVFSKKGSERGEYTIKKIDLNRAELVERRKERLYQLKIMIDAAFRTASESLRSQALAEVKKEADKDREYSAAVKSLLAAQDLL